MKDGGLSEAELDDYKRQKDEANSRYIELETQL